MSRKVPLGMLLILGGTHTVGGSVLLTHVSPAFRGAVILLSGKVINLCRKVDPHHSIGRAFSLRLGVGRILVGPRRTSSRSSGLRNRLCHWGGWSCRFWSRRRGS